MILPLHAGNSGREAQRLVLIERSGRGFIESGLDAVRFVPMEAGKAWTRAAGLACIVVVALSVAAVRHAPLGAGGSIAPLGGRRRLRPAQPVPPGSYMVKRGDTLYSIAWTTAPITARWRSGTASTIRPRSASDRCCE